MNNKYLLVDYGNTNIKAAIYSNNKIGKISFINNKDNPITLFTKLGLKALKAVNKVIVVSTISPTKLNAFISALKAITKANVKFIEKKDFNKHLDFSNIAKDVVIGNDLLLLWLYISNNWKKGAIFCLGTVYSAVIVEGKKIKSVLFIPSITKAINNISNITSIPSSLIPKEYNKLIGLNTPDCISSGANILLEGYVDNTCKKFKLNPSNVLITGGDSDLYLNLKNKYKVIDNLTLRSIPLLIKLNKW